MSAAIEKKAGDERFRAGDASNAVLHYSKALEICTNSDGSADDVLELELSIRLNRAAAYLRAGKHESCIEDCDLVLLVDPSRLKARFRRVQALVGLGKMHDATVEAGQLAKENPGNTELAALAKQVYDQSRSVASKVSVKGALELVQKGFVGTAPSAKDGQEGLSMLVHLLRTQPEIACSEFASADGGRRLLDTAPAAPKPLGTFATAPADAEAALDSSKLPPAAGKGAYKGRFSRPVVPAPCVGVLAQALRSGDPSAQSVVEALAGPLGSAVWEARPAASSSASSGASGGASTPEASHTGKAWQLPPGCSWAARDHESSRVTLLSEAAQQGQALLLKHRAEALRMASRGAGRGGASKAESAAGGSIGLETVGAVLRRAAAAADEVLSRSVGMVPVPVPVSEGKVEKDRDVLELDHVFVAALRAVGRIACTRMGADACEQYGLVRAVVRHAASGQTEDVRLAARSALARIVERRSRTRELPDDYMPLLLARSRADVARAVAKLRSSDGGRADGKTGQQQPQQLPDASDVDSVRGRRMLERHDPNAQIASKDLAAALRAHMKGLVVELGRGEDTASGGLTEAAAEAESKTDGAAGGAAGGEVVPRSPAEALQLHQQDKAKREQAEEERRARVQEQAWRIAKMRAPEERYDLCARAAVVIGAAFLVDRQAALSMLEETGVLPAVCSLALSPSDAWKEVVADVIGHMCADDAGRALMSAEVYDMLGVLAKSEHSGVRAAAAVSIAKTLATAAAQRKAAAGPAGAGVDLAKPMTGEEAKAAEEAEEGGGKGSGLSAAGAAASSAGSSSRRASREAAMKEADDRAIMELYEGVADALVLADDALADSGSGSSAAPSSGAGSTREEDSSKLARSTGSRVALRTASRSMEALACISNKVPIKKRIVEDPHTIGAVLRLASRAAEEQSRALRSQHETSEGGSAGRSHATSGALEQEWGPIALGACFIVLSIVRSEEEERLQALADKDISVKQWEEFQRLTLSQQAAAPDPDPKDEVDRRVRLLLGIGARVDGSAAEHASISFKVIPMLHALAQAARGIHSLAMESLGRGAQGGSIQAVRDSGAVNPLFGLARSQWQPLSEADEHLRRQQEERNRGPGAGVLQAISTVLEKVAVRGRWSRAELLQSGALPLLNTLSSELSGNSLAGRQAASHCLALLLMACNPNLLPESQVMDAVPPLLFVCRGRDGMQQFEAAVALTNVSSMGEDATERVVGSGGVSALQALVFEDHRLLRRAGTEALCNMSFHPAVIEAVTGQYLKLWLAMAKAFGETDPQASIGQGEGDKGPASGAGSSGSSSPSTAQAHARVPHDSESGWDGADLKTAEAAAGALATAASCDEEAAARLLEGGGVPAMTELLASGAPGLQLRAIASLEQMATVPGGWEALSRPVNVGAEARKEVEEASEAQARAQSEASEKGGASATAARARLAVASAAASALGEEEADGDGGQGDKGWEFAPLRLIGAIAAGTPMRDVTRSSPGGGPQPPSPQVREAAVECLKSASTPEAAQLVELACAGLKIGAS